MLKAAPPLPYLQPRISAEKGHQSQQLPLYPELPVPLSLSPALHIQPQTHHQRVMGSWQGPLGMIWSKPLLKQGHIELAAQDPVSFEYVQQWRLHYLCHLWLYLVTITVKASPKVQKKPPVFQCVLVASGPATRHH